MTTSKWKFEVLLPFLHTQAKSESGGFPILNPTKVNCISVNRQLVCDFACARLYSASDVHGHGV
jgi:hypothetical protein